MPSLYGWDYYACIGMIFAFYRFFLTHLYCLVGCLSKFVWTNALLGILYACVLYSVLALVECSWACLTWKGALETQLSSLLLKPSPIAQTLPDIQEESLKTKTDEWTKAWFLTLFKNDKWKDRSKVDWWKQKRETKVIINLQSSHKCYRNNVIKKWTIMH